MTTDHVAEHAEEHTAQEQQDMDHKRFESMYLQHMDILKAVAAIHQELLAMRAMQKQDKSFSNIVSALTVILMAAAFVSIATIIGYSR